MVRNQRGFAFRSVEIRTSSLRRACAAYVRHGLVDLEAFVSRHAQTHEDVAWQALDHVDGVPEGLDEVRAIAEAKALVSHRVQTVGVDDVRALCAFARAPRPRRRAGRVAWREVRGERDVSEGYHVPISDDHRRRDARKLYRSRASG